MTCVIDAEGRIKEYWGEVALVDLADYAQGSIIRGGAADWEALVHPGTAYHFQTDATDVIWSQNITMADGAWQGIGAGLERIIYDAAGRISVMGANFGVNIAAPGGKVQVHDAAAASGSEVLLTRYYGGVNDVRGSGIFHYHDATVRDILVLAVAGDSPYGGDSYVSPLTTPRGVMALTVGGRVIIGPVTTIPDGTLHVMTASAGAVTAHADADDLIVETGGAGGISILTPDANIGEILFGTPTDHLGAFIQWDYTNLIMNIGTHIAGGEIQLKVAGAVNAIRIDAAGQVGVNGVTAPATAFDIGAGAMTLAEMAAPGAGAANTCRLYCIDNAGKTELYAIFATGAAQLIAAQP